MNKVFYWLRISLIVSGSVLGVLMLVGMLYSFLPLLTGLRLRAGGNSLGTGEICADLLKGDYKAASEPIALKTGKRELRFGETVVWLGGKGDSPFVNIPGSQLFSELPRDLGPLLSCTQPGSANLAGDSLSVTLALGYEKARVNVTLRYSAGLFSNKLQRIEIRKPELITPSTPPPGETERKMLEFMKKLDEMDDKK